MKTLKQFKKEAFKNKDIKKAYYELQPELQIIRSITISRTKAGISQRALAKKIGVTQSALARFESGKINPTLSFLKKVTFGLGLQLVVR